MPPEVVVRNLAIAVISVDQARFQVRDRMREEAVERYRDALLAGDKLPPVRVVQVNGVFYLADGFHRYAGHVEAGAKQILCEVREGTEHDIIMLGIEGNALHGVEMTREDRHRGVVLLLEAAAKHGVKYTDEQLAQMVRAPRSTVARWRKEIEQAKKRGPVDLEPDDEPEDDDEEEGEENVQLYSPPEPPADLKPSAQLALAKRVDACSQSAQKAFESLGDVQRWVDRSCDDEQGMFWRLQEIQKSISDRIKYLQDAIEKRSPFELCLACNGDAQVNGKKCGPCNGHGWMSRETSETYRTDQKHR